MEQEDLSVQTWGLCLSEACLTGLSVLGRADTGFDQYSCFWGYTRYTKPYIYVCTYTAYIHLQGIYQQDKGSCKACYLQRSGIAARQQFMLRLIKTSLEGNLIR